MSAQIKDGGVVNALAVLDEASYVLSKYGVHAGFQLNQARDAVAELIEADILLDRTQEAYDRASSGRIRNDMWADVIAARKRRAAALARVGGAK